jgi:PAS domain S-box-containing protein
MKPVSRELKSICYLIVLKLFLFLFIPGMVGGEEAQVFKSSVQQKSQLKTIIVADYYPYTFVNKEGVPDGFSVDLIKAVAKVMGMDLEINVDTWEQAIRSLKAGEIDLLPMMAYSTERDKIFDFSVSHTIAFDAFFTRNDSKRLNTIEDLKGQTVIVMKGDQAHDYLLSSGLVDSAHLILINSLPEALRLLASGKADAALMPKLVGLTLMKDLNLTNLAQSPIVVESYNRPFSFAVNEGNMLLLERLGQGLSIIKKSGQYREIYDKWFGALEPKELSLKSVLQYIVGVFLALLLIGSAFALWSFSLRKEVALRTKKLADEIVERKQAEEELRFNSEIMTNLAVAIYLVKMDDGLIVYSNDIFEIMFGYGKGEMIGKNVSIVNSHSEKNPEETAKEIMAEIHEKGSWQGEVNNIRKDGKNFWCYASCSLFDHSKYGRVFIAAHTDITERKRTEEALKENERVRSELIAKMNESQNIAMIGSWEWNLKTNDIWWSDETYRIFGVTPQDYIPSFEANGKFIHPDDFSRYVKAFEHSLQTGETLGSDFRLVTNDGLLKHCHAGGKSYYDDSGQPIRFIGTIMDITERKQAQEAILKLNTELEQRVIDRTAQLQVANKELEAFSYSVSHDLRAPLRSIDGFSQALLERYQEKLDDTGKGYLERVRKATQRMGLLIDDMLKLSRVANSEFKRRDVNMSDMVRAIAAEYQKSNPDKVFDLTVQEKIMIQGDYDLIKIAMVNLMNNAWKFTGKEEHPRIAFGATVRDGETACFIRDNGAGFDMAYASKLFGAFQRLHTVDEFPGTGIGLATVQRIIHRHGGRVWAEGEQGKGATFYFTAPS